MSKKGDLFKQFEKALHEIDPAARVMVMEVLPGWNLDDKEKSDPVHFNPTQLQRVNDFLGPNYGVVETINVKTVKQVSVVECIDCENPRPFEQHGDRVLVFPEACLCVEPTGPKKET